MPYLASTESGEVSRSDGGVCNSEKVAIFLENTGKKWQIFCQNFEEMYFFQQKNFEELHFSGGFHSDFSEFSEYQINYIKKFIT